MFMFVFIVYNFLSSQEGGYSFNVSGSDRIFYGTIAVISADNPASSLLGGFKESASAYRLCRQCMGTKDEIRMKVSDQWNQLLVTNYDISPSSPKSTLRFAH